jgi:hypothetical protein
MAKQTRQPRMIASIVFELRVIGLGHKKAQKAQMYLENHFALFVLLCGVHFAAFGIALMWLAGTGLLPNVM